MLGSCIKLIINVLLSQYIFMSDQSEISTPPKISNKSPTSPRNPKSPKKIENNERQIQLLQQNKNLRRKLKQLSARLDDQLERAAAQKLKQKNNAVKTGSVQSQSLQLQNAYKMIERLQKTVKDFQSKQSYQISFKRILDLESIIKKKDSQLEELKIQIKDLKKAVRDKERHVSDLIDKQAVNPNLNEQKQQIQKLKQNLKKVVLQNQQLKKRQLAKHKKLVSAQRRLVQIEQQEEEPIGRQQELLEKLQQLKAKYKQAMVRIEKQNAYITKLNSRLSTVEEPSSVYKRSKSYHTSQEPKQVSKSMHELPDLPNIKVKPAIQDHLPQKMLRRYG